MFIQKPETLDEMFLPTRIYNILSSFDHDTLPNLLLSGKQGLGKTLTCEILSKKLGMSTLLVDLSSKESRSVEYTDTIKDHILKLSKKRKIIIINEVDNISGKFMDVLKSLMDEYATKTNNRASFLLTTNNPQKVEVPVGESRCVHINFNPSKEKNINKDNKLYSEMDELRLKVASYIQKLFHRNNIIINDEIKPDLTKLLDNIMPDFRSLHTTLEIALNVFSTTGKLNLNFTGLCNPNTVAEKMFDCYMSKNQELKFLDFITWYKGNVTTKHLEAMEIFIDKCQELAIKNSISSDDFSAIYYWYAEAVYKINTGHANDIFLIWFFSCVVNGGR